MWLCQGRRLTRSSVRSAIREERQFTMNEFYSVLSRAKRYPTLLRAYFDDLSEQFDSIGQTMALARVLQIYVTKANKYRYGVDPSVPLTSTESRNPAFLNLFHDLGRFSKTLNDILKEVWEVSPEYSPATLRNFLNGTSDSMRDGKQTYAFLSLFVTMVQLIHPEFAKESRICGEDAVFLSQLGEHWRRLTDAAGAASPEEAERTIAASPLHRRGSTPESTDLKDLDILLKFRLPQDYIIPDHARNTIKGLVNDFGGEVHEARFICYRMQREDPDGLMKSYLIIRSPELSGLSRHFTFVHFHTVDPGARDGRISTGLVLPLRSAFYCLGGQQFSIGGQPHGAGFHALSIIAVPWIHIEQGITIIPGLTLCTSNNGRLIVARLAVRPALAENVEAAKIGSLRLKDLRSDLEEIAKSEAESPFIPRGYHGMEPTEFQYKAIINAIKAPQGVFSM